MGGAGGAAGRDWTDDEIYGRAPPPGEHGQGEAVPLEPPAPGQQAEGLDYPPDFPGDEDIMEDPWADGGVDDGFFGGDAGGGGGGDWGGGDWF